MESSRGLLHFWAGPGPTRPSSNLCEGSKWPRYGGCEGSKSPRYGACGGSKVPRYGGGEGSKWPRALRAWQGAFRCPQLRLEAREEGGRRQDRDGCARAGQGGWRHPPRRGGRPSLAARRLGRRRRPQALKRCVPPFGARRHSVHDLPISRHEKGRRFRGFNSEDPEIAAVCMRALSLWTPRRS